MRVLLPLVLLISPLLGFGQPELSKEEDSLKSIWKDPSLPDSIRILALNDYIWKYQLFTSPENTVSWIEKLYSLADSLGHRRGLSAAHNLKGMSYYFQGNYSMALDYFQRSLKIREELGLLKAAAGTLNNIGLIYFELEDYTNSLNYFKRVWNIFESTGDSSLFPIALGNMSVIYHRQGDLEKALDGLINTLEYLENVGDGASAAVTYNHLGEVYFSKSNYDKALDYFLIAMDKLEETGNIRELVAAQKNAGKIYQELGVHKEAIELCKEGLSSARDMGATALQKEACECLYRSYKASNNRDSAFTYLERISVLDDSLKVEEATKSLQKMEFRKAILADSMTQEQARIEMQMLHEIDIQKKKRTRNIAFGVGLFILLIAGGLFSQMRYIRNSRAAISKERDRSEGLLLNILPAEIAKELKEKGSADARDFDRVPILFTDFEEFTQKSEKLSAQELVEEIDVCFRTFDQICEKYKIEKIKTIGDAYMAAGGLPIPDQMAVKNTVLAALEMQQFVMQRREERKQAGKIGFQMRAGIHTGPVVAGIVGVKKFQYDIWGDTVNTASRMESHGDVGKVNISQDTYELIKGESEFNFEPRGKVEVKGKGEVEMYFVSH